MDRRRRHRQRRRRIPQAGAGLPHARDRPQRRAALAVHHLRASRRRHPGAPDGGEPRRQHHRLRFPAPGSDASWDERHTVQDAAGHSITVQNAGPVQTIFDAEGQAISQSIWGKDGPEEQPLLQPAFLPFVAVPAAIATIELGLILYTHLATRAVLDQQPMVAFRSREYAPGEPGSLVPIFIGAPSRGKVEEACEKISVVQAQTDRAAVQAGRSNSYPSIAIYGTAVHSNLKRAIDALGDRNLVAEFSILKGQAERYGAKDSLRIDVLEKTDDQTVCMYDIKTGKRVLSQSRMDEIATNVSKLFGPRIWRIFVTEIRPRQ